MKTERRITFMTLLLRLIFLVAPTAVLTYFAIGKITEQYTQYLPPDALNQALWLSAALIGSYILHYFRARFLVTTAILMIVLAAIHKTIAKLPGEFDVFFVSARFTILSVIVVGSWISGFLLARWRYFPIALASLLFVFLIISRANHAYYYADITSGTEFNFGYIFWALLPMVLYSLYMMYMTEVLRDMDQVTGRRVAREFAVLIPFLVVMVGLLAGAIWLNRGHIKIAQDKLDSLHGRGDSGKNGGNSLLKRDKNGNLDLDKYVQLRNELDGQSNELLFCAHLDNYFPDPDSTPNPLYFTRYYYTKFDPKEETFARDSLMPFNDEFAPDVTKIPLFHTYTDSSKIKNGMGNLLRRTVTADVYVTNLALNSCVTPSTGYSVQPITVEDDYKDVFKAAYKTQSYISELNSAYFVYNIDKPEVKAFQERRLDILRTVPNYSGVDKKFMSYYTSMPQGTLYDSINALGKNIMKDAATPVDKVVAVRDYFLQKDPNGDPVYWYSLTVNNPGEPNMANASMLRRFLYKTHRGYCTYYAGATLFLLRSAGIPARVVGGFLTEDRHNKNKGWYWFYGKQAHAWVQVYFPGYGWLDFDTTVGNSADQRGAPQPDGTPPMQPPKAWFAATGYVPEEPDTTKRHLNLRFDKFVFHSKDVKLSQSMDWDIDATHCIITSGKDKRSLKDIHAGDSILVVSYDDQSKQVPPFVPGQSIADQMKKFPKSIIADEIRIKAKIKKPEAKKPQEKPKPQKAGPTYWPWIVGGAFLLVVLFLLSLPEIILLRLRAKARRAGEPKDKAYRIYRYAMYHLHQLGNARGQETPLEFARNQVDKKFGTNFESFMIVYLKLKYAKLPADDRDKQTMEAFFPGFAKQVNKHYKWYKRFGWYMNLAMTHRFFYRRVDDLDRP